MWDESSTIDCQDCGTVLRVLSDAEAQQVADNPYNYVWYCRECKKVLRESLLETDY